MKKRNWKPVITVLFLTLLLNLSFSVRVLADSASDKILAVNQEQGIHLTWTSVDNAAGYTVLRTDTSGNFITIDVLHNPAATEYLDHSDLLSGSEYTYRIEPFDASGNVYEAAALSIKHVWLSCPKLTATGSSDSVLLTVSPVEGAEGYLIYRKTSSTDWEVLADLRGETTYTDLSMKYGSRYVYRVLAYTGNYTSAYNSGSVKGQILTSPTVTQSCQAGVVTLKWTRTAGAKQYVIYRKTGDANYKKIRTLEADMLTFEDDLKNHPGVACTYRVCAVSDLAVSGYQKNAAVKYLSKVNFTVKNTSDSINLHWNKVTGSSSYLIYRKNGTDWELLDTLSKSKTDYIDTDVKKGTAYTYSVRAKSGISIGAYAAKGKKCTVLEQPAINKAVSEAKAINISWKAVKGASGYHVYRRNADSDAWKVIKTISGSNTLSYKDKDIKLTSSYAYAVSAIASNSESSHSSKGIYCVYSTAKAFKLACKIVNDVVKEDMSRSESLRAVYDWHKQWTYKRDIENPLNLKSTEWINRYAVEMYENKTGNCYRYASGFAYVAAVLGYTPKVIIGEVTANAGGFTPHALTEITMNGTKYYFDPRLESAKNISFYKKTMKTYPYEFHIKKRYSIPKE